MITLKDLVINQHQAFDGLVISSLQADCPAVYNGVCEHCTVCVNEPEFQTLDGYVPQERIDYYTRVDLPHFTCDNCGRVYAEDGWGCPSCNELYHKSLYIDMCIEQPGLLMTASSAPWVE